MNEKNDYTINGKCPQSCGKCCTGILPLSDYEIKKIRKYIQHHDIIPYNPNKNNNVFNNNYEDSCPFLDKEKRCQIYIQRPEVCRWFMCNSDQNNMNFHHEDKRIINMLTTFFPEEKAYGAPDIGILDKQYQEKKREIKALKEKKNE